MTKSIELSKHGWKYRGMFRAIIDDCDFELINSFSWSYCVFSGKPYAVTTLSNSNGEHRKVLMHQMIMGVNIGMDIDHIDGNGLNNSRYNLRVCTHAQNVMNSKAKSSNITGFKGVRMRREALKKPFTAQIQVEGKLIHLGYFKTASEAAISYNKAALKYFGEFARLNKI